METNKLRLLHELYIKNLPDGAAVFLEVLMLAALTEKVQSNLSLQSAKVHIKAKTLKHMYEKRPASVYDFLLDNLAVIIRFPDQIYQNPSSKRGSFIFAKKFDDGLFMVSIESNAHPEAGEEVNVVVTAFKVENRYLAKYKLIWSWEDGDASS